MSDIEIFRQQPLLSRRQLHGFSLTFWCLRHRIRPAMIGPRNYRIAKNWAGACRGEDSMMQKSLWRGVLILFSVWHSPRPLGRIRA